MSRVRQFFQTAFTYFAGNIFSKLVTFFMIPLYTNQLPPSEYGDYDFVVTIITFFISFPLFSIKSLAFGMECFYFLFIAEIRKNDIESFVTQFIFI